MAERTRSLLSRTAPSGRPTVVNCGKPKAASISTSTKRPSIPTNAPERMVASITSGASEYEGKKQGRGRRLKEIRKGKERGARSKELKEITQTAERNGKGLFLSFFLPIVPFPLFACLSL